MESGFFATQNALSISNCGFPAPDDPCATQGALLDSGLYVAGGVQVSRSPRVGTELRDHRAFLWSENMCEGVHEKTKPYKKLRAGAPPTSHNG